MSRQEMARRPVATYGNGGREAVGPIVGRTVAAKHSMGTVPAIGLCISAYFPGVAELLCREECASNRSR